MMKVLVVGGTGTIGRAVVGNLSKRHEVLIASKSSSISIDMSSADSIQKMYDQVGSVDAVICTAGEAKWALARLNFLTSYCIE